MADVPQRSGSIGGLIQGQPIICGGYVDNSTNYGFLQDCLVTTSHPNIKINMLKKRTLASSVVLNQDTLWVIGGEDDSHHLKSTEFIKLNQTSVEGPELPFTITSHCAVKYKENKIFFIGELY